MGNKPFVILSRVLLNLISMSGAPDTSHASLRLNILCSKGRKSQRWVVATLREVTFVYIHTNPIFVQFLFSAKKCAQGTSLCFASIQQREMDFGGEIIEGKSIASAAL